MSNLAYKQGLTSQQLAMAESEYNSKKKSTTVAWLLWLFTGGLGGHRFYLGHTGYAVCLLLFGWMTLGLWPLIDAFFINKNLKKINEATELNIITRVKHLM